MSDEMKPDVKLTSDVEEPKIDVKAESEIPAVVEAEAPAVEEIKDKVKEIGETVVNYAEMSLAKLSGLFEKLMEDADRLKKSKEAEAIKSAFYKRLSKEKAEAGLVADAVADAAEAEAADAIEEAEAAELPLAQAAESVEAAVAQAAESTEAALAEAEAPAVVQTAESVEAALAEVPAAELATEEKTESSNPFEAIEAGFKSLYNKYRKERAENTKKQEAERVENLAKKQAIIEELKALVEKQEDVSALFPEFRELQSRWRSVGSVPAQNYRMVNDTYQFYVEQFYDKVQINRDMRDLDFKKNLEAKEKFCEQAEKLAEDENVVGAFKELQKLHEQWKEYGPVAKEYREKIWDRFKAATAVINKKYQGFFEGQKEQQAENLAAKTKLCEQVEAIAEKEDIKSSNDWNAYSKQIEDIQKVWRTIGYASRKENQKIYDRFRAACDKFYEKKRVFYSEFKDRMNDNMEKKLAIIEQAETLKSSTEWKKATDQFIALQKQWKEIGAVPRKKSEQLWKRFRAACDEFFAERDKQAKPDNQFYSNLKAKKALIEEIKAFETDDPQLKKDAAETFNEKWKAIGFVPFKEKDAVAQAFKEAMQEKFPDYGTRYPRQQRNSQRGSSRAPLSEKDKLVQQYNELQQQIDTYENNIGFFAASKNSQRLIQQMQERIEESKNELKKLEAKIREAEDAQE